MPIGYLTVLESSDLKRQSGYNFRVDELQKNIDMFPERYSNISSTFKSNSNFKK